ncbi:MAG: hypothetical protein ACK45W_11755 [Pseudanabaena sp.]|jgi:hypothetical protein
MEDLEFKQIDKIVNYRYIMGQCNDMSEMLEFTKIQLLNSTDNCLKRVFNWGYKVYENEDTENDKNIEVNDKTIFIDGLNLAKKRYVTGQTKNLKEIFSVIKMIVTEDIGHSIKRLISDGFSVIDPTVLNENENESVDYGHAFDDILGIEEILEHCENIDPIIIPNAVRTIESLNICQK